MMQRDSSWLRFQLHQTGGEGVKAQSLNKKGFRCWLLFLLFVFSSQALCSFEERLAPDQIMDKGRVSFKNGQFQESIYHWKAAAALYEMMEDGAEEYLRACINLAAAYRSLETHEEADQLLDETLERAGQEGFTSLVLPAFLLSDHKVFEVDSAGNQAMLSGLVAFNNRWFLESIRHWEQAAERYDEVDSGEEAGGRVHIYLAIIYERFGDEIKKEKMLKEALARLEQKDVLGVTLPILLFDQKAYAADKAAHLAMIKGLVAFRDGQFEESILYWKAAIGSYEASVGEDFEGIDNLRAFLAMSYESMEKAAIPALPSNQEAYVFENPADQMMNDGLFAFSDGRYRESIQHWQEAVKLYDESDETVEGSIRTRVNLVAAYESIGEHKRAKQLLQEALAYAEKTKSAKGFILAKSALGAASTFSRQAPQAEPLLMESLALAYEENDTISAAYILNNLGNLYMGRENYEAALNSFSECIRLAENNKNTLLKLRASLNTASCLFEKKEYAASRAAVEQLSETIQTNLPDGYDKAYLLVSLGQLYYQLAKQVEPLDMDLLMQANTALQEARKDALKIRNSSLISYADGHTGRIYEMVGRYEEALIATRSAEFHAQEEQMPDALYLWQWQKGRIFAALGKNVEAIEAYRNSLETLQTIRHDIAIAFGNSNRNSSFRQELGSLFYELADLLIQQSDQASSEGSAQTYLLEARNTIELLKSAELEDYFQDDCVNLIRSKTAGVDTVLKKAAVLYFIPLKDRTELLLTLPSGLKRYHVPAGADDLIANVEAFRNQLVIRTRHTYKRPAKKLYDLLIRPIESDLEAEGIETLVFIPDGALSTIPMAALHDGEKFLVEKYAVATTPGLNLMDPKPIRRENLQVLVNGLSESVQGFPALPSVPYEVEQIESGFDSTSFIDENFLINPVKEAFESAPYGIVHIASHGQFASEAKDTFLLTYNEKLTLDDLERLIRPSQFRGNPVELLTLSACQTAAGDDRAALGLAGVAIKAGARSAMATLWFVSDEASAKMVTSFYGHLKDPDISKAMALRKAQLELIDDPRFRHPRYWSPYLIIGNWL